MNTPQLRYAVDKLLESGGVYPESYKTALCIYRHSRLSDIEAQYKALLLQALVKTDALKDFIEDYVGEYSLTYRSSREARFKEMARVNDIIGGRIVKVRRRG